MEFYILWLTKIFNVSNNELIKFLSLISPEKAYNSDEAELKNLNLTDELISKLISAEIKDSAKRDFDFCQKENIKLTSIISENYPHNLLTCPSPPVLLYYKGNILPKDEIAISIVGSRKYSEYGKVCTKKFASELASCGVTVISGMAYGIDAFSHAYSIASKGRTIAILGSGINQIYPKENTNLYYEIIENGAVISEFPLNTPPLPKNFPIRNRIVAGLSLGTLVIEADKKSGTMITAGLAAEAGRNVYAVPGGIFSQTSRGTNLLIKDGAKPVMCTEDILEDIYLEISQEIPKPKQISLFSTPNLSEKENVLYKKISLSPITIDELIANTNLPVNEINSILMMLEINGYIKALPGKQYVITV